MTLQAPGRMVHQNPLLADCGGSGGRRRGCGRARGRWGVGEGGADGDEHVVIGQMGAV